MSEPATISLDASRIERTDIRYDWHSNYYDGPLSGACEYAGERFWFHCFEEDGPDPSGEVDEDGDRIVRQYRRFKLVRLTLEEWADEDSRHRLFRECVGDHTDYDPVTQRRAVGALRPQQSWHVYYDRYPPNPAHAMAYADRPAAYWYEV